MLLSKENTKNYRFIMLLNEQSRAFLVCYPWRSVVTHMDML